MNKQTKWYSYKQNGRYGGNDTLDVSESIVFGSFPSLFKAVALKLFKKSPDIAQWFIPPVIIERSYNLRITWIGHATFLIQVAGKNILTDPIFFNITPLFRRLLPAGIALAMLPPIDYVLISHNHRDHMDRASLLQLQQRNPFMHMLVPEGNKSWFDRHGFTQVTEYAWWQQMNDGDMAYTFLPAVHWSGRGIFDRNKTLWGSWMIQSPSANLYFGGDTAFGNHFSQIAAEFTSVDCALLPIGPCEPRNWMKRTHMNAIEAVEAFSVLNAHHFIPMHWGTFPFGSDHFDAPLVQLQNAWKAKKISEDALHCLKIGEQYHVRQQHMPQEMEHKELI
jgi:L-ascorbate metabolism protein UlaG (beta-lactamase superfamily)